MPIPPNSHRGTDGGIYQGPPGAPSPAHGIEPGPPPPMQNAVPYVQLIQEQTRVRNEQTAIEVSRVQLAQDQQARAAQGAQGGMGSQGGQASQGAQGARTSWADAAPDHGRDAPTGCMTHTTLYKHIPKDHVETQG